ncbi:hypothetical protein [Blastococcus sp. CT_GayMR16]|uniref:hypothetical protein n=1 Tax=Blastococcus sp. CT_GayMR16 TaxID=2559607 RepID=UPI0010749B9C|nr:hypothetical protein [Blastococcus sp. CT_GayMR16]TFV83170.1 hypothetical protein E4P38_21170 [Blastococcus sp. CT_GayMR16]
MRSIRLRRGTWQPGQAFGVLLIVQIGALLVCLIRGLDYLRPDDDASSLLSRVQDSAPLTAWGALFIAAAITGAIGFIGRWGPVIAIGHLMAALSYASVAFGLFLVTGIGPGVRTPVGLAWAALVHGSLGVSIFAVLRRRELIETKTPPERA